MISRTFLRVAALAAVLLAGNALAQTKRPPATPAPATPAPAMPAPATLGAPATPAPDPAQTYSATDLDALRPLIGQTVSVTGTVLLSGESKTKTVRYLNFTKNFKESLGLVFFVSKGGEEFDLDKLSLWVGKKVIATGKVGEFNGSLQMQIEKMDQVKEAP